MPLTLTFTATGAGNYTVPAGYARAVVEVWGGGAGGDTISNQAGGGGGGGFISGDIPVVQGSILYYFIGAASAGGAMGNASWLNKDVNSATGAWTADGGFTQPAASGLGGTTGTGSVGTLVSAFNGGQGGAPQGGGGTRAGSGGGGSAGPLGAGGAGAVGSGGTQGAGGTGNNGNTASGASNVEGGGGGAGGLNAGAGVAGGAPGGGGGGSGRGSTVAGAGGRGQVRITLIEPDVTAPTITSAATANVAENATLSHALTANESVTWSIRTVGQNAASVDHTHFEISGSTLRFAANGTKNFETPQDANTDNVYVVVVRATDLSNNVTDQTISITVTNVVNPTITSSNTATVLEGDALAKTVTADMSSTWAIVGGADAAQFGLTAAGPSSSTVLQWAGGGTKSHSAPSDANSDNVYVVTVRATSSNETVEQTLSVTVTPLTITTAADTSFVENSTTFVDLTRTGGSTSTWSIVGGADQAKFFLRTATSLGIQPPDFDAPTDANLDNVYAVRVRVVTGTGITVEKDLTFTITKDAAQTRIFTRRQMQANTFGYVYLSTTTQNRAGNFSDFYPNFRADDILCMVVRTDGAVPTPPAGWSTLGSTPGQGTSGTNTGVRIFFFWKRAVGTETGDFTHDVGGNATYPAISIYYVLVGAHKTSNPFVLAATTSINTPVAAGALLDVTGPVPAYRGVMSFFAAPGSGTGNFSSISYSGSDSFTPSISVTGPVTSMSATGSWNKTNRTPPNTAFASYRGTSAGVPGYEAMAVEVVPDPYVEIASAASALAPENLPLAHELVSNDHDGTAWSIVGGADAAKFAITNTRILGWAGGVTKNFEAPDDADANGAYQVTVQATLGALSAQQAITVTLANLTELPLTGFLPSHKYDFGPPGTSLDAVPGLVTAADSYLTGSWLTHADGGMRPAGTLDYYWDFSRRLDGIPASLQQFRANIAGSASGSYYFDLQLDLRLSGVSADNTEARYQLFYYNGGMVRLYRKRVGETGLTSIRDYVALGHFGNSFTPALDVGISIEDNGSSQPVITLYKDGVAVDVFTDTASNPPTTGAARLAIYTDGPKDAYSIFEMRSNAVVTGGTTNNLGTPAALAVTAPVLGATALSQSHALGAATLAVTAPALGTPAATQRHTLSAATLAVTAPVLGTPAVTQAAALAAPTLAVTAPVLGVPAITQAHIVASGGLSIGTPVLGTPTVTQAHVLAVDNVINPSPVLATPVLQQGHGLGASALTTGPPDYGPAPLTQTHTFAASFTTSAPTLDAPVLVHVTAGSALPLTVSPPVLGSPALTQQHALSGEALTVTAPALGTPVLGVTNLLAAQNLAVAAPVLGTPTLGQAHSLASGGQAVSSPVFGTATFTQTHALSTASLAVGSPAFGTALLFQNQVLSGYLIIDPPTLGAPTLTQVHQLAANNFVTEAPAISLPAFGGTVSFSVANVITSAPVLGTPALTQVHALSAASTATGAPVLATPALTVVISLTAANFSTTAPISGTPALTQRHALSAPALAVAAPTLGTATVSSTAGFAATPLTVNAPTLGTPALTQRHQLGAEAWSGSAATLGTPTLAQAQVLAAPAFAVQGPTLGAPTISQGHQLAGLHTPTAPVLAAPTVSQSHVLSASFTTEAPEFGVAVISQAGQLASAGIVTGAPVLGPANLTQVHALAANGLTVTAPTFGSVSLGAVAYLTALDYTTAAYVLGVPSIAQRHVVTAPNIVVGSPVFGTATFGQVSYLTANGLTTGVPAIGGVGLTQRHDLQATGLTVTAPALAVPTLTQRHVVSATPFAVSAPVLGQPLFASVANLTAYNLVVGGFEAFAPGITQTHAVNAEGLDIAAPVLGFAALGAVAPYGYAFWIA